MLDSEHLKFIPYLIYYVLFALTRNFSQNYFRLILAITSLLLLSVILIYQNILQVGQVFSTPLSLNEIIIYSLSIASFFIMSLMKKPDRYKVSFISHFSILFLLLFKSNNFITIFVLLTCVECFEALLTIGNHKKRFSNEYSLYYSLFLKISSLLLFLVFFYLAVDNFSAYDYDIKNYEIFDFSIIFMFLYFMLTAGIYPFATIKTTVDETQDLPSFFINSCLKFFILIPYLLVIMRNFIFSATPGSQVLIGDFFQIVLSLSILVTLAHITQRNKAEDKIWYLVSYNLTMIITSTFILDDSFSKAGMLFSIFSLFISYLGLMLLVKSIKVKSQISDKLKGLAVHFPVLGLYSILFLLGIWGGPFTGLFLGKIFILNGLVSEKIIYFVLLYLFGNIILWPTYLNIMKSILVVDQTTDAEYKLFFYKHDIISLVIYLCGTGLVLSCFFPALLSYFI